MEAKDRLSIQPQGPESWLHAMPERWKIGIPIALVIGGIAFAFCMMENGLPVAEQAISTEYTNVIGGH